MSGDREAAGTSLPPPSGWEKDERVVAWVYGAMLTGAATVVASAKVATRPFQMVVYVAVAAAVFWLSHAYAAFVGHGGRFDDGRLGRRLGHSLRTEFGVFESALPALAAIAIAVLAGADISAAGYAGSLAAVATMAAAAAIAAHRTGAGPPGIAVGAVSAFLIGALLIFAKLALK